MGAVLALVRALRAARFALWRAGLRARLARHGITLVVRAEGVPRYWTLPVVEVVPDGRGGTFTLELGEGCGLGRGLVLEVWAGHDNRLAVGPLATIESWCRVQLAGGTIEIGRSTHVRDLCLLKTRSTLRIGERVVVSRGANIHATSGVEVGDHVGIGERTSLIDSDHTVDGSDEPYLPRPLKLGPIVVGRNVAISANCVLLRGTTVGPNAVIAAGAVLNGGEFPGGWLIAGAPATAKRALPAATG